VPIKTITSCDGGAATSGTLKVKRRGKSAEME
jgi:hypothetical protein